MGRHARNALVALAMIVCSAAHAAPCMTGGLVDYLGLGSTGCTIGSAQFSGFSLPAVANADDPIAPSAVQVVPAQDAGGAGFSFRFNQNAGAAESFGLRVGFLAAGLPGFGFTAVLSSLTGASSGDGSVGLFTDLCLGSGFWNPDTLACGGTPDSNVIPGSGTAASAFAFSSPIGVVGEVFVDGGFAGAANLASADLRFVVAAVPEPGAYALLTIGLGALVFARRRERVPRPPSVS
jgi:hypothetical protein